MVQLSSRTPNALNGLVLSKQIRFKWTSETATDRQFMDKIW